MTHYTVRLKKGQLPRGLTPRLLSVAVRWGLFSMHGWMSHDY